MNTFSYHTPTDVYFGKDQELRAGELVKRYGGSKVLIHFGGKSAKKSGLLDRVEKSLKDASVPFVELGGVEPNPKLSLINKGIELCKEQKVDFILAVGGGSVIDSSKGIGVGARSEGDVWDYYLGKEVQGTIPVGVILTIAAAGSETSISSVVTKDEGHIKRSIDQEAIRPEFAILNPELTYTLPQYQIACGVTDIMMHTMERYFATDLGNELTDRFAEQVLRNMIKYGPVQYANPSDYKAASEIMWTGSISHVGLTGLGSSGGDWSTHLIGHELSGRFEAAHGATLATVWGSWARFVWKANPLRFVQYAANVWGCDIDSEHPENTVMAGIEATERFFHSIGMPTCIPELLGKALADNVLGEMADLCVSLGRTSIGDFKVLSRDDVYSIYSAANK